MLDWNVTIKVEKTKKTVSKCFHTQNEWIV